MRVVPAVGVDHVHAVAVPGDDAVGQPAGVALGDVRVQVGDAGDGDDALDALVGGADPPRRRPAARATGDADALAIDLLARFEVVDAAHRVPQLDAGRRVAQRHPP